MDRHTRRARPTSFTVLAFVFFWLALAGLGNTWVAVSHPSTYSQLGVNAGFFAALSVAYGLTTAVVAIGFWRAGRWLPPAIAVWGASLIIGMIAFQAMIGVAGEPRWLVLLPHVLFVLIILSLFGFTQHRISLPTPAI